MQADTSKDTTTAWEILQSTNMKTDRGVGAGKGSEIIGISCKKMV